MFNLLLLKRPWLAGLVALVIVTLLVINCSGVRERQPQVVQAGSGDGAPERVLRSFYGWYGEAEGDPLADGSYRRRPELTAACVERVSASLAATPMSAWDPFFCAAKPLSSFAMDHATVEGDRAKVTLRAVDGSGHRWTVLLLRDGGDWRIDRITCGA